MLRRSISFLIYVLLESLCLCQAYQIQCPHVSQWNYRAYSFQCPQNRYMCLYNTVYKRQVETCGREEEPPVGEGHKYVLSHNPDKVYCSLEYYQPFIFTPNGNSQCTFKKSMCNEEGQVIATNGSRITDRTCRCDYTQNYVYVTPPNDVCSCVPSEEDCSCYHRPCLDNEIMISDYICYPKDKIPLPETIKCKEITSNTSPQPVRTSPATATTYKQFSETNVSEIEASIPILSFVAVFVILAFLLCVNVRPHVTITEAVYRKDLIVTEHCGKNITVIEGESLQLQCKFKSILPVKSTTWQHNLNGKIQNVNSNTDQTSSVTSHLNIDNIKSSHSGRYECILTNIIGLSNTLYNCCPSFIKNLHACRPEDKNYIDINVCRLPDKYETVSVFKGEDGILEINNQNYSRVMWFKHDGKLTGIDQTDRYNTENMENKTSLTIKAADFKDEGRYVCVFVNRQGIVEPVGIKFRVIPKGDMYNNMIKHRKDEIYVKTADVNRAMGCLQLHGTVVITGRIGTGKSTLCLELASLCEKHHDYLPYRVDLLNPVLEDFGHSKILCIIDCKKYEKQDTDQMKTLLGNLGNQENVWFIFTCPSTDFASIQSSLQESQILKERNVIDLNDSLTSGEKKEILQKHMTDNNIAESSSTESNFKSKEILQNNEIQVKIDRETIEEIIQTEPLHGFPQTAVYFCKDRALLHTGKRYFTNLPMSLEIELYRLVDTESTSKDKTKFCILAHIATDENKCLDKKEINIDRLKQLYFTLYTDNPNINLFDQPNIDINPFDQPNIDINPSDQLNIDINPFDQPNFDINPVINNAIKDLEGQFILEEVGKYVFIHPYVLATIYTSHEYFTDHLIRVGSLSEIKEFIRSSKYKSKEGDLVCKWGKKGGTKQRNTYLCKSLLTYASQDGNRMTDVGSYIYKQFIKLQDEEFYKIFISQLNSRIYSEKSTPASEKSDSEDLMGKMTFWQTAVLLDELTDHGKDSWALIPEHQVLADKQNDSWKSTLQLLCGLITLCFDNRQGDKCKDKLLTQFIAKLDHYPYIWSLMEKVDIYGNSFFHYLVLLSEDESIKILQVNDKLLSEKNREMFGRSNKIGLTPLDMTAYLGKLKLFILLLDCTKQDDIDKNQRHLLDLTKEGRIFKYHDTKITAKEQKDKMSLNFEEGLLRYIQYGTEKDFLDIVDLHKTTKLNKNNVRKRYNIEK